jgi:hypothetical protein
MDNIIINDDENSTKNLSVEIPFDPDMKEPGSVRGNLISDPEILTDKDFEKLERRNYITKVKTIALDILDRPLFINPKDMKNKDKEALIKICKEVIEKFTLDQITERFNHIICRDVLTHEYDISTLPIYSNKN